MFSILNVSKSGMLANQNKLNVIGQNIVNSQTNGYKRIDTSFVDLEPETLKRGYIPTNKAEQRGNGVKTTEVYRDTSQGVLNANGRLTDLAIDGEGLFSLTTPKGDTVYSRVGSFNVDSSGQIVDLKGNVLNLAFKNGKTFANSGITAKNLNIDTKGNVSIEGEVIGQIKLYKADGSKDIISVGENMYKLKEGVDAKVTKNNILKQGYVEASNVDMVSELTNMMSVQKSLQLNSKGMQMANDMWGMVNNLQLK